MVKHVRKNITLVLKFQWLYYQVLFDLPKKLQLTKWLLVRMLFVNILIMETLKNIYKTLKS